MNRLRNPIRQYMAHNVLRGQAATEAQSGNLFIRFGLLDCSDAGLA